MLGGSVELAVRAQCQAKFRSAAVAAGESVQRGQGSAGGDLKDGAQGQTVAGGCAVELSVRPLHQTYVTGETAVRCAGEAVDRLRGLRMQSEDGCRSKDERNSQQPVYCSKFLHTAYPRVIDANPAMLPLRQPQNKTARNRVVPRHASRGSRAERRGTEPSLMGKIQTDYRQEQRNWQQQISRFSVIAFYRKNGWRPVGISRICFCRSRTKARLSTPAGKSGPPPVRMTPLTEACGTAESVPPEGRLPQKFFQRSRPSYGAK